MLRLILLAIILISVMASHWAHIKFGTIYPSVHAVCPVGGLENLWSWLISGQNIQKIFSGTMTLFFLTLFLALVLGRTFCGNICPFGAVFEFTGKLTSKKISVEKKLDSILRTMKYLVLIGITLMAWRYQTLWISEYDPSAAFSHIWEGMSVFQEAPIGATLLVIILLASLVVERFFCKYLCPAGALYGLFSKVAVLKIHRAVDCYQCGKCSAACPQNIDIMQTEIVADPECIACGRCIDSCPKPGEFLRFSWLGKTIKPVWVTVITLLFFFGSLFLFQQLGIYRVTVPSVSSITESGKYLQAEDLRGSMTIEMAAKYTGKDLAEFYTWMEIPPTVPKETVLKEITSYIPNYNFEQIKKKK